MKSIKATKSWRQKLATGMQPKLVDVPDKWALRIGHGKMLVPSPLLIDTTIKKIPKGRLVTVNIIREWLANEYKADMTCPLTTGIFLNIAANAAEEEKAGGKTRITPYWRVLKEGGSLNPKFPGGVAEHARHLEQEGFEIIHASAKNKLFVKDFERKLALDFK